MLELMRGMLNRAQERPKLEEFQTAPNLNNKNQSLAVVNPKADTN